MPAATEVVWRAYPKQGEFLRRQEHEVLFGGAAGPGKSEAMLMLAIMRCTQHAGAHVLYLRRELDDLRPSAIKKSLEILTGTGPRFNQQVHTWYWPNGSELRFAHAQYEHDVLAFKSQEYDLICLDELTEFTFYQYDFLKTRNRSTKVPSALWWMRCASNPGGVGHQWVKGYFIDVARETTVTDPKSHRTKRFVPAKLEDNPALAGDGAYDAILESIADPDLRRAMREGDWDIFAGQAFAEWRYDIHTVDPFAIPPEWQRFTATDWGYNDGCATLWFAVDPDSAVWIYRERYARGVGAEETGREIVALGADERIAYRVVGADVDQRRSSEPTIGELLRRGGFVYRTADMTAGSRVQGAQVVHDWLRVAPGGGGNPTARLRVFRTCTKLIREIPALVYDSHRPEDVDDDSAPEGHADLYAALRYGLMSRPRPTRIERPKPGPGTLGHIRELARRARAREEALGWKG